MTDFCINFTRTYLDVVFSAQTRLYYYIMLINGMIFNLSRWFRMKQEQCTTEEWQVWRFGVRMWMYSEIRDGEGGKKPPEKTRFWPENMLQVM